MAYPTQGNIPAGAAVTESATKVLAQALSLAETGSGTQSDEFVLGLEQRGFIRDFLNRNNPLMAYTQMIDIMEAGAGSVTVKWDGVDNDFVNKANLGDGDVKDIDQKMEVLFWNKPVFKSEGLSAYDIKKGALNTLAYRMEKSLVRFTQESIKRGFKALVDAAESLTSGEGITGLTAASATVGAKERMIELVKIATKFITDRELSRDQAIITVSPVFFDELAFAGLLGDRTTVTYAAGQYSVATLGGYRIQSGEMFLPAQSTKAEDGTTATKDLLAIIAPTNSVVSKVDIIAANVGKLGISNDTGTYIELADINKVPKYITDYKLAHIVVEK